MASRAKGIPENSSVVMPRLVCRDPAAAIDFCVGALGAVELGTTRIEETTEAERADRWSNILEEEGTTKGS